MSKVDRILRIVEERDRYKADLERQLKTIKEYRETIDEIFEWYASKVEGSTAAGQREAFYTSRAVF